MFYDHGYTGVYGLSNRWAWNSRVDVANKTGNTAHPLRGQYKGIKSIASCIEKEHPGYIHELYRFVQMFSTQTRKQKY